jgi:hypothetical protein
MLYGNISGRPYGWAAPAEVQAMLRADAHGPDTCPPAIGGDPDDWYLAPAADDFHFWMAWHQQRGSELEWLESGIDLTVRDPEITFYCGTHLPYWLWSGEADFPLCVSYGRLRPYQSLHRGTVPWICDSRGFSELAQHGTWTISPEEYLASVARFDEEIGGMQWASPQDWMCEPEIIHGGRTPDGLMCAGTGLSVAEHQRRTVDNFLLLVSLWPRYSSRPCPIIPVLQGDSPEAYLRCYQMYLDAGVDLGEDYRLAGVGSVCRLQSTRKIVAVARVLGQLGLELHWFGLKLTGIARPEVHRDITTPFAYAGTQSLDSASWSRSARYAARLPGCEHAAAKCNNCPRYAARWRDGLLATMAATEKSPARTQPQGELFTEAWEAGSQRMQWFAS